VLLSTPLHASSNFTVSVQLANKRGLKKSSITSTTDTVTCQFTKLPSTCGRKMDDDISAYSYNQPSAMLKVCKSVHWIMSGVTSRWISLSHTTQKCE
jgi:hypothetical protein